MLAGDAGLDAEQRGGLAFALVELGFTGGSVGGGFVCCHCFVSLNFSGPGRALSPASRLLQVNAALGRSRLAGEQGRARATAASVGPWASAPGSTPIRAARAAIRLRGSTPSSGSWPVIWAGRARPDGPRSRRTGRTRWPG